jgi:hypothetical protein
VAQAALGTITSDSETSWRHMIDLGGGLDDGGDLRSGKLSFDPALTPAARRW